MYEFRYQGVPVRLAGMSTSGSFREYVRIALPLLSWIVRISLTIVKPDAPRRVVRYTVSWFIIPAGDPQCIFVDEGAPIASPPSDPS
jgi:hypothetical protein